MPRDHAGVPKMIKWELPNGDKTLEYSFGLMHQKKRKSPVKGGSKIF